MNADGGASAVRAELMDSICTLLKEKDAKLFCTFRKESLPGVVT